jgi:hypothetical protein
MQVAVEFQNERLDFELAEDRVVASWFGPAGLDAAQGVEALRDSLEGPLDYPALRQIVVPGDSVVVAFDPLIGHAEGVLGAITQTLGEVGIASGDITLVAPRIGALGERDPAPGLSIVWHDPADRGQLAYLATTKQGRRIYLNRHLTDADVVVPIAPLRYDPFLGYRGPWSLVFPELSDRDTQAAYKSQPMRTALDPSGSPQARSRLDESLEVSWLLGSQFHIGLVQASYGFVEAVAGRETSVREHGLAALDRHWRFRADSRADLVVIGIGQPDLPTTLENLAAGLVTATRLVRHGGKIVVLSRAAGTLGPALTGLSEFDDPKGAAAYLRRHETAEDYLIARQLAQALEWADIFLLSSLPDQIVESLALIVLESPEQARRLVAQSASCLFVSGADRTSATVPGDE